MKSFSQVACAAVLMCITSTQIFAQGVGINSNGAAPDPSAGLDINFSDKGLLPPRLSTSERNSISNPANGLVVYNTDTDCLNIWNGSSWRQSCYDCDFATPVIGNNGPVCAGGTLNLTCTEVPGATYSWIGPNGFSSTDQNPSIQEVTTGAGGVYTLQVTVNGCTASALTTFVTVNSIPVVVAGNSGAECPGGSISLTASNQPGGSYSWTGPNGYFSSVQNPVLTNVDASSAGNYLVTVTVNGCPSSPSSTAVTINPAIPSTPGTVTGPTGPNGGNTEFYSVGAVSGATSYTWTVPSGSFVATGQGSTSAGVTFGSISGDICVTADNSCGSSPTSCLAVTVMPQGCKRASDNTVWCIAWTETQSGNDLCGRSSGYSGTYYPITNEGAAAHNKTVNQYGDCATNYIMNGNPSQIMGTTMSCWNNVDRWNRNAQVACSGCFPVVRCTNLE